MSAPTTTEEIVDLVRRSGLIDPQRLESVLGKTPEDDVGATPRQIANRLVAAGLVTQFQAEQFLLGKWRGFTIGKYKVLERLGFGGNGTVYLCEHLVVRRRVAVKVLTLAKAANPIALARFYREARAAGVLDHPNLVQAFDVDQENGVHFLVMEYVDGSNLQALVARAGPLSVARAAHYIRQAAQGLQAAHEAGLVHRDIKPSNILLDRTGTVKILDLGLARFCHDETDMLTVKYQDDSVLGTADYVAPEQALDSHGADIRADIYGLGCTFYFLLTGRPPFPEGHAAQKLIAHQTRQPTPVRDLRPEVPAPLAGVLATMMAKDPAQRYQTPAEIVDVLTPWTATPIPPPSENELPQLSPAARAEGADPSSGPPRGLPQKPENPALSSTPMARPGKQALPIGLPGRAVVPSATRKPVARAGKPEPPPAVRVTPTEPPPQPPAPQPTPNGGALRMVGIIIAAIAIGVAVRLCMIYW